MPILLAQAEEFLSHGIDGVDKDRRVHERIIVKDDASTVGDGVSANQVRLGIHTEEIDERFCTSARLR